MSKEEIICLLIPLVGGFLSGIVSITGIRDYELINKPILALPGFIFPIIWTILYVLMGISSFLIYNEKDYHSNCCLKIYGINLFMNFLWSPIFFGLNLRLFALIWIILLDLVIIYMIICFYKVNKKAAYIQIPYLIWSLFATYLNLGFYLLNR